MIPSLSEEEEEEEKNVPNLMRRRIGDDESRNDRMDESIN
jgi:hypothetical protein